MWLLWTRTPKPNFRTARCLSALRRCWAPLFDVLEPKSSRLPFNIFSVTELPLIHSYRAHNLLDRDGFCCKLGLTSRALLFDEGVDLRLDVVKLCELNRIGKMPKSQNRAGVGISPHSSQNCITI